VILLARMLLGDRVLGLDFPIERVLLQSRFAGHLIDDITLFGTDHYGAERVIDYQSKRSLDPIASDKDFAETIGRCLQTIQAEGDDGPTVRGHHRFGLVSNPSNALHDLARLTDIARSHDRAGSFVELVRRTCAKGVRDRLTALRTIVATLLRQPGDPMAPEVAETDVDQFTWQVAKALHVWEAAADASGEAVRQAIDRLDYLVIPPTRATEVWDALEELAHRWTPQAASISPAMVRAELETKGLALDAAAKYAGAFRILTQVSQAGLDTGAVTLGRTLQLPRHQLRAQVIEALADRTDVWLSGRPGVGKSSVGRLVATDLRADGATVVAISLAGRSGSLSALEADLGVALRDAFAGAPIGARRVLVIDGVEQALTDAGHILSSILDVLPDHADAPGWQLVLTAREEAVPTISRLLDDCGRTDRVGVTVSELDDDEVAQVVSAFPMLEVVQRSARAAALLLRRPYLVELLIRAAGKDGLPAALGGEEDLITLVIRRLVRCDDGGLVGVGHPEDRIDTWLRMADAAIAGNLPVLLTGCDALARQGLLSDDIIARPGQSLSYRFAHDVQLDYAVAARLSEPGGRELLAAASPRPLLRAVRLWMQRELAAASAEGNVLTAWESLSTDAAALVDRDGDRWLDVPYEALMHLGAARRALADLTPTLLDNHGSGLATLIDVAERRGRLAASAPTHRPIPLDPELSGPVVDLLGHLGSSVPPACRAAAMRLVHHHLAAAFTYRGCADAGIEDAAVLPGVLISWVGDDEYGDSLELCAGAMGFLAAHLAADTESLLVNHARQRPDVVAEPVESVGSATALSRHRPDLALRLAGLFYVGEALDLNGPTGETTTPQARESLSILAMTGYPEDAAVRDHDVRQAGHLEWWPLGNNQSNPTMGPFLALLQADPAAGLRLIGAVVDTASVARQRAEARYAPDESPVAFSLRYGQPCVVRDFSGPATVWCWHRRTTVGPGPALSALMALRQWASAQITEGNSVASVRDLILGAGTSLAFPAVAWFVSLEHFDQVGDEMDLLLARPEVWELETSRCNRENDLALDVPEMTRLTWTAGDVAMQLVLRGDTERREQLTDVGRQLAENAAQSDVYDDPAVRRWADVLDISHYETRQIAYGVEVFVRHDAEVERELNERAAPAVRALTADALLREAVAMRDGQADRAMAEDLWQRITAFLAEPSEIGMHDPRDLLGAAATGVIAAAHSGITVNDSSLREAVATMLDAAAVTGGATPPSRDSLLADDSQTSPRFVRDMVWTEGFDRSAAIGLPIVMGAQAIAERAAVPLSEIAIALQQVAASPHTEARLRLREGLQALWRCDCDQQLAVHDAVLAAVAQIVRTAGYAPWNPYQYAPATLPDPVGEFLDAATSDELVLDLDAAAYAIPVLTAASDLKCPHAAQANQLLDTLIAHDELVWPRHYVREQFGRDSLWRGEIDLALARRILAGDHDCLRRRLEIFAPTPEGVTSLLHQLQGAATDTKRAVELHALWPSVLDALLPEARVDTTDAYHRDIEELDNALLLVPERGVDYWPWDQTLRLAIRWRDAFSRHAELADRAILLALNLFGATENAAHFVLPLLVGADPHWMKASSRYVVHFAKKILEQDISAAAANRLRSVLDELARIGDEQALGAQRELENT
jgi:hypothetical protein